MVQGKGKYKGQARTRVLGSVKIDSSDEFESVIIRCNWKLEQEVLIREAELVALLVLGELGDFELQLGSRKELDVHRIVTWTVSTCLKKRLSRPSLFTSRSKCYVNRE